MPLDQSLMSVGHDQPDPVPSLAEGSDHQVASAADSPSSFPSVAKRRRLSKVKALPEIRRSLSTPHMRSLALGESGALSPTSDKRRNKLGYHRTSVACGHCRRRKIRCLQAPDDSQGRCSNCIRLKKECNFYPVDQVLSPDPRASGSVKMEASNGAPSTSSSSSPRTAATPRKEHMDEFGAYQTVPSHTGPGYADADTRYGIPSANEASLHHHGFPYTHGVEGHEWASNDFSHHPPSADDVDAEAPSSTFWRLNDPPPTATLPSKTDPGQHYPYAYPTTRSMSYGNIEGLPNSQAMQQMNAHHDQRQHSHSYAYPHALNASIGPLGTQPDGEIASGSMSAPVAAQPISHLGYQQTWPSYPAQTPAGCMPPQAQGFTNPWCGAPRLGQVEEELNQGVPFTNGLHNF